MRLYADNDFGGTILLESLNPATGLAEPIIDGVIETYIASSPTADIEDALVEGVGTYVGTPEGTWSYFFDGGSLDHATLAAAGTSAMYLIIKRDGDVKVYVKLTYTRSRPATLA